LAATTSHDRASSYSHRAEQPQGNIGRSSDVTTVVLDDATAVWGYTAELLAFMCKNV
jgi:hypothetical protein